MSYAKTEYQRSSLEKIFVILFIPAVIVFYLAYKYPEVFLYFNLIKSTDSFYFLGKHPSFWYATLYSFIVCSISLKVLIKNHSPYRKGKIKLSSYQQKKFLSIFLVQFILLYVIPFYILPLMQNRPFFSDPITPVSHDAFVYVSKGFTSWGGMVYVFLLVPLSVYLFGKRYCSWFCACGNLAETIGVTVWGSNWVKYKTPTGKWAQKLEKLQSFFLVFGLIYGLVLFMDFLKLVMAPSLIYAGTMFQNLVVDFTFGAIIGVGAYPFLGTRIWCRYGCPLARMMVWVGRYGKSRFKVQADDKCKGINACSVVCPMGIDVASYAHLNRQPIMGSFGLNNTSCIGCGGCIDSCPVSALHFA